jgi:hypothetical protein
MGLEVQQGLDLFCSHAPDVISGNTVR